MINNILIIDSNDFEIEKLKLNLNMMGKFSFTEITSPNDFLLIKNDIENLSLIIMDIEIPKTIDGFFILSEICKHPKISKTPIIIVSNENSSSVMKTALSDYGVKDYIMKPFQHERIYKSVKSLITIDDDFIYSFENSNIISIPTEDFIIQQLNLSKRTSKPLSLLFITPRTTKLNSQRDYVYKIVMKYIKLSIRTTDIVLTVNNTDIFIILHCCDQNGAGNVTEKIIKNINLNLDNNSPSNSDISNTFNELFYISDVTFPNDGKDLDTLISVAMKKTNKKSALDNFSTVSENKFNNKLSAYRKLK